MAGIVCIVLFLLVLARMTGPVAAQRHAAITDGAILRLIKNRVASVQS
jgi:hypothetical protein